MAESCVGSIAFGAEYTMRTGSDFHWKRLEAVLSSTATIGRFDETVGDEYTNEAVLSSTAR